MNADPVVMEYLPKTLSPSESQALTGRIEACFAENGYGLWAVELVSEGVFIGFVGLSPVNIDVPFAPAVEVGWRLARPYWGEGFATEAAATAITFAFTHTELAALVSFTAAHNQRSRSVMERLGMQSDPGEDFELPGLDAGDPRRRHVLYRLDRDSDVDFGGARSASMHSEVRDRP
jgi:RimJ/RimL family protein N-acetyltransferase